MWQVDRNRRDRSVLVASAQVLLLLLALGGWELVGRSSARAFFFVGTPAATARELWSLIVRGEVLTHFLITGGEALLGLLFGTMIGSIAGLSLWYSRTVALVVRPFILGLSTLPVFAFAPLMIVWFGVGLKMKIAMATFATVFVSFSQAYRGANLVSSDYVDILRGLRASHGQIFRKVIVPGSLDWVLGSMRLNVGLGLLGAFIGEFIASDRGLGYLILRAGGLYNVPRVLAAAIGIIVLALLFDFGAALIEKHRHLLVQSISVPRLIWR